jgi:DivIVA domain-containing protein
MVSSALPGERFKRRRFGPGYDVESVETFLAQVELGAVTAGEVEDVLFKSVYRGGYDETEVDEALDALTERLAAEGHFGSALPGERFTRRKYGRGYDAESVETFLARVELDSITASDVNKVIFRAVNKGGYDAREVDVALDALAERLTAEGRAGSVPTEPDAQPRSWLSRLLRS